MAPFARLFTMAFFAPAKKNNPITTNSLYDAQAISGLKYKENHQNTYTRVASLATPPEYALKEESLSFSELPVSPERMDLSHLSELLGASPRDLLSLESSEDGVRGVFLKEDVSENDTVLSIPLDSCLRDDDPPSWFREAHDEDDSPALQPGAWATRLGASLIDKQLGLSSTSTKGMDIWLSLLPDATFLSASLPIHWDEQVLSNARCTALELAVDSAYFTRAEALADLNMALQENDDKQKVCEHALDLVQTRSCRVETPDGDVIRLLAPIFDFINHACIPNAVFALEGDSLVVRATKDVQAGEQVTIDYGDSARPQWRCLASYGFMPEYSSEQEEENVAEVYVHGKRFEVGPSTIPVDLVEAVEAHAESEGFYERPEVEEAPETVLTPDIAMRIARRVSEVAFQLLLDPNQEYEEIAQLYEDALDAGHDDEQQSPQDVISARLAASLRFAQHRTLLACANGLIDWATGQRGDGRED